MNTRRRTHLVAVLVTGGLLASCTGSDGDDHRAAEGRDRHWDKEAGAAEASAFMRGAVPEDATGTGGAVRINPQQDVHPLSFVTSGRKGERIAADLGS
ncbi:hypothetical protein [Streptomyces sp. NPDC054842]